MANIPNGCVLFAFAEMSELEQKIEAELELMRAKLHKRGPHAKHFAQAMKEERISKTSSSTSSTGAEPRLLVHLPNAFLPGEMALLIWTKKIRNAPVREVVLHLLEIMSIAPEKVVRLGLVLFSSLLCLN